MSEQGTILSNRQKILAERQSEREESKMIVREIIDYGISQKQILYIIRNLALELEDTTLMKSIYSCTNEIIEKSTIIVPGRSILG